MRSFACDAVLLENKMVLLIKRAADPFKGEWALPGGRIENNESAENCLEREMREETGLIVKPLKFVAIYSDPERDPRGIITAAYLVKRIGGELHCGDDAAEAKWFPLNELPSLCSDHEQILKDALSL